MLSLPSLVSSPPLGEGLLEILTNDCGAVPKRDACTRLPSADDSGRSTSTHDNFDIALVDFDALALCDPTLDFFLGDNGYIRPLSPGLSPCTNPAPAHVCSLVADRHDVMGDSLGNNDNLDLDFDDVPFSAFVSSVKSHGS